MQILDRRSFLAITGGAALAASQPSRALAGLGGAEVFTADASGALVDSVVVLGERSALLVDAQMTAPNASALADVIEATGRRLETIFISHYHPDHVLGLGVLAERFPEARAVAHGAVQPKIEATAGAMLAQMGAGAPAGVFAKKAVVPEALGGDHLMLEGERIDVLGPMAGDTEAIAALHIPALDTVIAADLVYSGTHVWTAEIQTPEALAAWRGSLDALEGIGAGTVIPGHRMPDTPAHADGIAWTRAYLAKWEAALGEARSAEELKSLMADDSLGLGMAVDRAAAAAFPEG